MLECCWSYKSLTFIREQRYPSFFTPLGLLGRRFSSPLLCSQIFMHDPWGGERPIDDDLLAQLLEDEEQSSLLILGIPFSHTPSNKPSTSPSNLGRVKSTAQKKKPTNPPATNPQANQPAPRAEILSTSSRAENTPEPRI